MAEEVARATAVRRSISEGDSRAIDGDRGVDCDGAEAVGIASGSTFGGVAAVGGAIAGLGSVLLVATVAGMAVGMPSEDDAIAAAGVGATTTGAVLPGRHAASTTQPLSTPSTRARHLRKRG